MADAQPLKLVGLPYKSSKNRQKWNFTKSKIGEDWTINLNLLITNVKKSFENLHPVADAEPLKLVGFPYKPSKNWQKLNSRKSKIAADRKINFYLLITNLKEFLKHFHPVAHTEGLKLARFPYKPSKNWQKLNFTKSKITADRKINFDLLITNRKEFWQNFHTVSHTEGLKLALFPYKPSKNWQKSSSRKSKIAADRKVNFHLVITNMKQVWQNSDPVSHTEGLKLARFPYKPSKNWQKLNSR